MIRLATNAFAGHGQVNWALADQTLVSGANFLTALLLARALGLEAFGVFTLAWMAVLLVNGLQHGLVTAPMMTIGPKQPADGQRAYFGAVLSHGVLFAVAAFAALWGGGRLLGAVLDHGLVSDLALPVAAAAVACQWHDLMRRYFFMRGDAKAAFAIDAVRYVGQLAVIVALFALAGDGATVSGVVWALAVVAIVAATWGATAVPRPVWDWPTITAITVRHWRFGKWLTLSAVLQWVAGNLFLIAAGSLLGTAAVGALKAAQTLMGVTHVLFQGLENVAPVDAARHLERHGAAGLRAYLRTIAMAGGGATALVALLAIAAPGFWLDLVFGGDYAAHGHLLRWYAVIYLAIFAALPLRIGLRTLERTREIFTAYLCMGALTVAAAYPLVLAWGTDGVCAGLLAGNLVLTAVLWRGLRRALDREAVQ